MSGALPPLVHMVAWHIEGFQVTLCVRFHFEETNRILISSVISSGQSVFCVLVHKEPGPFRPNSLPVDLQIFVEF